MTDETTTDGAPEEEPTAAEQAEVTETPAAEAAEETTTEETAAPVAEADAEATAEAEVEEEDEAPAPRVKPSIPGADLEVDIVEEGADPFADIDADADGDGSDSSDEEEDHGPITTTIELAADARYRATGKRKTAVARVTLKPGTGQYLINGRSLDVYFPARPCSVWFASRLRSSRWRRRSTSLLPSMVVASPLRLARSATASPAP